MNIMLKNNTNLNEHYFSTKGGVYAFFSTRDMRHYTIYVFDTDIHAYVSRSFSELVNM